MSVPVVKLSNKEIVEKYFASKPNPDGPDSHSSQAQSKHIKKQITTVYIGKHYVP
jgi:hypothetical protein